MTEEGSLGLDVASFRRGDVQEQLVRVGVVRAYGFTKDGGAPTLSRDCRSLAEIEREIARLRDELDTVLARARTHFGASDAEEAVPATASPNRAAAAPAVDPGGVAQLAVADAMTRDVRTVGPNDLLSVADELMKVGRFRHVVVVDEGSEVVGVISHRDIFHGALAWSMGMGTAAHERALDAYPAKQVMQKNVVSVDSRTPLAEAAALFVERKVGCLPVVDAGTLVGILTEGDLLSVLTRQATPR